MKQSTLAVLSLTVVCVAAGAWIYDRHHLSVMWPAKVQREVLGNEIANADALISKERSYSLFGEGFARWRYEIEGVSPAVQRLCDQVDVAECSFTRSRTVQEGVMVSVTLSKGVLTVEEWWS